MISGQAHDGLAKKGALYQMMEEFHRHWDRIDIISAGSRWWFSSPQEQSYFGNVFVHVSGWPLWLHPFFIRMKGKELFNQYHFGAMTVQDYPPFHNGIGAWLLWRATGVPYLLEVHHVAGRPKAANFKEEVYLWLAKLFIFLDVKNAKAVRVVNQSQVGSFLMAAGVQKEKIRHIPSAYIDLETYRPYGAEKKYDVIFVGRLVENKGIKLFLDGIKQTGCSVLLVGDGPLKKEVELSTNHYPLITMHGWAKDAQEISHLLDQSKVLVMCSYNEGGPRVVLEAMATGVPVVATAVGLVPDLIVSEHSGLIVDWGAGDIANAIQRLLADQSLYDRCRRGSLEIAKNFEKKKMIENYANEIKKMRN